MPIGFTPDLATTAPLVLIIFKLINKGITQAFKSEEKSVFLDWQGTYIEIK